MSSNVWDEITYPFQTSIMQGGGGGGGGGGG